MDSIGTISYSIGSGVFLALSLVLMTGQRGRPHKVALMLASLVSFVWMAAAAYSASHQPSLFISYLLEPLRDLALLAFLVWVLSAAYTEPTEAARYRLRTLSILASYTVLLVMMLSMCLGWIWPNR